MSQVGLQRLAYTRAKSIGILPGVISRGVGQKHATSAEGCHDPHAVVWCLIGMVGSLSCHGAGDSKLRSRSACKLKSEDHCAIRAPMAAVNTIYDVYKMLAEHMP